MVFRRRKVEGEGAFEWSLATIRDIVEIVAIVAAGVWAFYTFVYENQIKPALSKPEVQFETKLVRLGERKGLLAIELHGTVKNVGQTEVWFYAVAESVVGLNVHLRKSALPGATQPTPERLTVEPAWVTGSASPVFAAALLTKLGDSRSKAEFSVRPGQSFPFDHVFYVAAGRFDELRCYVATSYAPHGEPQAYSFRESHGVVHLVAAHASADADEIDTFSSVLSLW